MKPTVPKLSPGCSRFRSSRPTGDPHGLPRPPDKRFPNIAPKTEPAKNPMPPRTTSAMSRPKYSKDSHCSRTSIPAAIPLASPSTAPNANPIAGPRRCARDGPSAGVFSSWTPSLFVISVVTGQPFQGRREFGAGDSMSITVSHSPSSAPGQGNCPPDGGISSGADCSGSHDRGRSNTWQL